MKTNDPRTIINGAPMSARQWVIVGITVLLNALDGFDVLSISFASPGISREWGLSPDALGWVLAMELIGMALGSILLGSVADRFGRKPTIAGCLTCMTAGMFLASQAASVSDLLIFRLVTGLGIGGLISAINAVAAEVSSQRYRGLALSLMVIGYPLGGVLGGLAVQGLLADGGWRDIFSMGALATGACIPLVLLLLPETPAFLSMKQPKFALARINRILRSFALPELRELPGKMDRPRNVRVLELFDSRMAGRTLLIAAAYLAHITSFYFVLKWIPKITIDLGFSAQAATASLSLVSLGGALGGAIFGGLAVRFPLRMLTILTMFASFALISVIGTGPSGLFAIGMTVFFAGFFVNSGIAGLYAFFARVFPTHLRATGTGLVVGVGRGGAALAPVLAGYLFAAGIPLQWVCIILGSGSLLGALALLAIHDADADEEMRFGASLAERST